MAVITVLSSSLTSNNLSMRNYNIYQDGQTSPVPFVIEEGVASASYPAVSIFTNANLISQYVTSPFKTASGGVGAGRPTAGMIYPRRY